MTQVYTVFIHTEKAQATRSKQGGSAVSVPRGILGIFTLFWEKHREA